VIANLWALIKAVPTLKKIFDGLVMLYHAEMVREIDYKRMTIDNELEILYKKVSEAKTNEERATIANAINRINNPGIM
jgi:hypothetical protein